MSGVAREARWTKEQDLRMLELRDHRTKWKIVAAELGRSVESCCARYRVIAGPRPRFVSDRHWTEQETAKIVGLLNEGVKPRNIAAAMGKDLKVIYSKIQQLRQPGRAIHIELLPRVKVSTSLLEDRDRRLNADRDITSMFFGDPAPGQSALDKKQGVFA